MAGLAGFDICGESEDHLLHVWNAGHASGVRMINARNIKAVYARIANRLMLAARNTISDLVRGQFIYRIVHAAFDLKAWLRRLHAFADKIHNIAPPASSGREIDVIAATKPCPTAMIRHSGCTVCGYSGYYFFQLCGLRKRRPAVVLFYHSFPHGLSGHLVASNVATITFATGVTSSALQL